MKSKIDAAIDTMILCIQIAERESADARRSGLNPSVREWHDGHVFGLRRGLEMMEAVAKDHERRRRRQAWQEEAGII